MKSVLSDTTRPIVQPSFPSLYVYPKRSGVNQFVVLFTSHRSGMVVYSEENSRPVGQYGSEWAFVDFVKLDGKIELSN